MMSKQLNGHFIHCDIENTTLQNMTLENSTAFPTHSVNNHQNYSSSPITPWVGISIRGYSIHHPKIDCQ